MWIRECGNLLNQRLNARRLALVLLHTLLHYASSSFPRAAGWPTLAKNLITLADIHAYFVLEPFPG
jgi:hypothetical protein